MKQKRFTVLIVMLICFLLWAASASSLRRDYLLQPIASRVLRFRILADSNSAEDQSKKLAVRDAILNQLENHLSPQADKKEIESYISAHTEDLLSAATQVLPEKTAVSLKLTTTYFPAKTYGSLTFPQGNYDALLVRIGKARGTNWWCCLYPRLCFTDAVTAVVTEESEQKLKNILTEEDFSLLEGKKEVTFWLLEWAKELFGN